MVVRRAVALVIGDEGGQACAQTTAIQTRRKHEGRQQEEIAVLLTEHELMRCDAQIEVLLDAGGKVGDGGVALRQRRALVHVVA